MKSYLILLTIISLSISVSAQDSLRNEIYSCFVKGDIEEWKNVVSKYSIQQDNPDFCYEYALAYYGLVGYYVRNKLRKEGRIYLDELTEIIDKLLLMNPDDPRFLAMRGAAYGYEMFFNRHKIFTLGPKSIKVIDRAVEMGPDSPHPLIENGNKTFHMPRFLGGSKDEAINIYHQAINAMEKDPAYTRNNWFYLNALTVLAGYYDEVGLTNRSRGLYIKINNIEPDYEIVKIRIEFLSK